MIALQVEGFKRANFGAHQAKIADGEALFGFAQFGWKQQGQGHFKGEVDDGFVVGRNGQEQFVDALFFELLDEIGAGFADIVREKGIENQLRELIFQSNDAGGCHRSQTRQTHLGINAPPEGLELIQCFKKLKGNVQLDVFTPLFAGAGQAAQVAVFTFDGEVGGVMGVVFFVQA